MGLHIERHDQTLHCKVSEELTIYRVNEYRDLLVEHMLVANEIILDLDSVTEIDSAGLQLLIAIKNLMPTHRVEIIHHNASVLEAIELSGLAGRLDDVVVIAPGASS